MRILMLCLTITLLMMVGVSCSRSLSPVLPSEKNTPETFSVSDALPHKYYPGVFGAWKVELNKETLSAEIIPARNAAKVGDIFDSDLSQFLTVNPCHNCLQIGGVRIGRDEFILLDIYIKHPFANIAARPDLHGFDVRAIFMGVDVWDNTIPIKYMKPDGSEENINIDPWFLLNADGFTSHYDGLVNDTRYFIHGDNCPNTVNPYLRFFESYSTGTFDPNAPSGYNVMPVGSTKYMRTAVFYGDIRTNLSFYIVADVAYGQSAVLANRKNPQYYLPAFNRTEPWRMEYWVENNNLSMNDANSTADVVVQVFDWQHNATVDPSFPNPANPSGIKESSKVTQVILFMPDMMNNSVSATVPESGDGSVTNPLQYRLQVKNEKLVHDRTSWGIVAIRDELYGSAAPSGRLPVPVSPVGFPYETVDIRDYSYYGVVFVNIPYNHYGDVAEYKNEIYLYKETTFSWGDTSVIADFFMDTSHRKFQYDWDYDYDGVTFDVDGSGMPSPWINIPVGKTNMGLRVKTNSVPPREYIYTIPVYKPGEEYDRCLSDHGEKFNITSRRGSNSIAVIGGKVCLAYSSNMTGNREVYVMVYDDRNQSIINSRVSNSVGSCFDPVLTVKEEGAHAGVYVAFVAIDGSSEKIMSSFGNPYAGGFPFTNIKEIASVSGLLNAVDDPCIVFDGNAKLTVYYHRFNAMTLSNNIRASQSTDFAQTWSSSVSIDPSSNSQRAPAAIYYKRNYCYYVVWEDNRNFSTSGTDLYWADSDDGLTFDPPINLSTSQGQIHETNPSIASYNSRIGIAYLQYAEGQTNKALYLMDIPHNNSYKSIVKVESPPPDKTALPPSLGMGYEDVFTICYGYHNFTNNTNEIRLVVVRPNIGFPYYVYSFPSEDLGITSSDAISPYPAVVSKPAAGEYAVESFIAHRSFRDGASDDSNPFPEKFGYIDVKSIIYQGYSH